MPTEQMLCVFLILYIHSIYGILYMYITKYGCVFLKLGESIYIRGNGSHSHTLGFAPARPGAHIHNAQHSRSLVNPRRACAARVTVVVLCVCVSTTILGLQATRRLMSDTNSFSATRARKIMWRFC